MHPEWPGAHSALRRWSRGGRSGHCPRWRPPDSSLETPLSIHAVFQHNPCENPTRWRRGRGSGRPGWGPKKAPVVDAVPPRGQNDRGQPLPPQRGSSLAHLRIGAAGNKNQHRQAAVHPAERESSRSPPAGRGLGVLGCIITAPFDGAFCCGDFGFPARGRHCLRSMKPHTQKRAGPDRPGPFAVSYCFAALYYFFMVLVKLSRRVTTRLYTPGFLESGVKKPVDELELFAGLGVLQALFQLAARCVTTLSGFR